MRINETMVAGLVIAAAVGGTASAAPLDISTINGVWQNQVGGTNVTGLGTSNITWGDGTPPDSGYSFTGGPNIVSAALDVPLFLGTFAHINETIPIPNLSAVELLVSFNTNGAPPNVNAVFPFSHDETSNTGPGCCDDVVTITTPIVNIPIVVGSDTFYFNLLGFSKDGGATFDNVFTSPEDGRNDAGLYGRVTQEPVPTIPEPASLILLGTGLAGAALRRRGRLQ